MNIFLEYSQTPEAEEACGQAITKALEYFPTSAEALQIVFNLKFFYFALKIILKNKNTIIGCIL